MARPFSFRPVQCRHLTSWCRRAKPHPGWAPDRQRRTTGADGVVFVADSQEERLDANFETMENLQEHLKEHNLNFDTIPYVLQLNKRDLPNAMSVPELTKQLQKKGEPVLEGVAIQGIGVFETLKEVAKLVLAELKKGG